jgi:hypothetical protein
MLDLVHPERPGWRLLVSVCGIAVSANDPAVLCFECR